MRTSVRLMVLALSVAVAAPAFAQMSFEGLDLGAKKKKKKTTTPPKKVEPKKESEEPKKEDTGTG